MEGGQEPHTPGGTISALQFGGKPRKPRSHTVGGGQEPHTAGGTTSALRFGGKPRKPRSHTVRSGREPHTPGGTVVRCGPRAADLEKGAANRFARGHYTSGKEIGHLALNRRPS